MNRLAVLLVEDDPLQRGFVERALEALDVDVVSCATVERALEALAARDFILVIADLHLGEASGYEIVERLAADRQLGGAPRMLAYSSDLTEADRERLRSAGVWRVLSKPVSIAELEACVSAAAELAAPRSGTQSANQPQDRHASIDASLQADFVELCIPQFRLDILTGDDASVAGDVKTLLRLSHDLKTVLRILGMETAAENAAHLEQDAAAGRIDPSRAGWAVLRNSLALLCETVGKDLGP